MINNNKLIKIINLIIYLILLKSIKVFCVSLDLSTIGCDGNCIQEMGKLIEVTPTSSILYSNEQAFMSKFFKNVCNSYREVDECLLRCESKSKQVADLKTAYAGLQFNFLVHCLAFLSKLNLNLKLIIYFKRNEIKGVKHCSIQINRSQETTLLFTNAIISREFHSMQMRFSALCRDLSSVIRCMLPIINSSCGDRPASLLLNFIGLEFSSFDTLYQQLGFDSPLPISYFLLN
uniref:Chondroitin proteoglycan 4 domain-containing protein n=1 Tax=Meloidogyne floridensis TaxID=298350 RepID=A0A915PGI7_9BILA